MILGRHQGRPKGLWGAPKGFERLSRGQRALGPSPNVQVWWGFLAPEGQSPAPDAQNLAQEAQTSSPGDPKVIQDEPK